MSRLIHYCRCGEEIFDQMTSCRRCSLAGSTGYLKALPRIRKPNGSLEHIICEGSREHVLSYSNLGTRCSEPECEINRQPSDNDPSSPTGSAQETDRTGEARPAPSQLGAAHG